MHVTLVAVGLLVALGSAGSPPEDTTLLVGPELVDCTGAAPMKCLQVKESPERPWRLFYSPIEGFSHEPGYEYELRVRVTAVPNPPADASNRRYSLIEVVERRPAASAAGRGGLEGPVWRLRRLGGRDETAVSAGKGVTVRFERGRVAGVSACNQFSGTYRIEEGSLVLGPLAGTMMACPEPAMTLEQVFREAFAGRMDYKVEGDLLMLGPASDVPLVFRREPAASLEGAAWSVTGYNNGRQAVVSLAAGTAITLAFREGSLTGNAGCNDFRTSFTLVGDRLTLGPPAATRKACLEGSTMAQEQAFLAALGTVATWRVHGSGLELRTENGALAVVARAADPPRD